MNISKDTAKLLLDLVSKAIRDEINFPEQPDEWLTAMLEAQEKLIALIEE